MGNRKILFISRYEDVISEFLYSMRDNELDVEIDTASNGTDAIRMLNENDYQIVVTGLSLDGRNGEQIITYLNKNFPRAVCIIYATSISSAQLHFFINERNVFRVFLRPVNFRGEFFQALEEAFEYHEVRVKEDEEAVAREVTFEQQKLGITSFETRLSNQPRALRETNRYMRHLMLLTIKEYGGLAGSNASGIAPEVAKKLIERKKLEWEAVDLCCKQDESYEERIRQAERIAGGLDGTEESETEP